MTTYDRSSSGSPPALAAPSDDLLETLHRLCSRQEEGLIEVKTQQGTGDILVRGGQIARSRFEKLEGEEAFLEMAGEPRVKHRLVKATEGGSVSIGRSWEDLLIIAADRQNRKIPAASEAQREGSGEALFVKIAGMTLAERLRLALRGDRECRTILIRDPNRLVQMAVISNPRLTESEVTAFACYRSLDEEVLRRIAETRDWIKLYPVRLALARNPKTPTPVAIKLLGTLLRQDLRQLAGSKDVPVAVANTARRLLLQRERKGS